MMIRRGSSRQALVLLASSGICRAFCLHLKCVLLDFWVVPFFGEAILCTGRCQCFSSDCWAVLSLFKTEGLLLCNPGS